MQAVRVYEMRQVDELIVLDIGATPEGKPPGFELIEEIAEECFMPLTVGGGISSLEDIRRLLSLGADKVSINSAATPEFISQAATKFGSQCIVVSVDARVDEVYTHCGHSPAGETPASFAAEMQASGAGEILLNSIERDGTQQGYALDLIKKVTEAVTIPVIACGGAGSPQHCFDALRSGASAVAASAMYQFTETTPRMVTDNLGGRGVLVRGHAASVR